ncbi:MAG: hypothetical protein ABFS05_11595 [Bacteroidota bacterium]
MEELKIHDRKNQIKMLSQWMQQRRYAESDDQCDQIILFKKAGDKDGVEGIGAAEKGELFTTGNIERRGFPVIKAC